MLNWSISIKSLPHRCDMSKLGQHCPKEMEIEALSDLRVLWSEHLLLQQTLAVNSDFHFIIMTLLWMSHARLVWSGEHIPSAIAHGMLEKTQDVGLIVDDVTYSGRICIWGPPWAWIGEAASLEGFNGLDVVQDMSAFAHSHEVLGAKFANNGIL